MKLSIRKILSFLFIIAAILPYALVAVAGMFYIARLNESKILDLHADGARDVTSQIEHQFLSSSAAVEAIGTVLTHSSFDDIHAQTLLEGHAQGHAGYINAIFLLDRELRVQVASLANGDVTQANELIGLDFSRNSVLHDFKDGSKLEWSDSFLSVVSGGMSVAIAMPFKDGLVVAEIDLQKLSADLQTIAESKNLDIFVIDRLGRVIAGPDSTYTGTEMNLKHLPIVEKGLASTIAVTEQFEFEGVEMIGSLIYTTFFEWRVLVAQPVKLANQQFHLMGRFVGAGLAISIAIALFLALLSARFLAKRFEALTSFSHSLVSGEGAKWEGSGIGEIEFLAIDMDHLAAELKQQNEMYRVLFQYSYDAIFVYDPETTIILDANKATSRYYGYSIDELKGMSCLKLSADEKTSSQAINSIHEVGSMEFLNRLHKKKDGTVFPVNITGFAITIHGKDVMYAVAKDITRQKQLEEQLRQTQKMEAIGTLAGGIAHDFNNLLFAILGNADLAADDLLPDDPVRKNIEEITVAGHRAAKLVEQILTFARRSDKKSTEIQVSPVLIEAVKMLRATLPTTISISIRQDTERSTVIADPTEIHQIIMNLCTNAGQAMMEQGGELSVSLAEVVVEEQLLQMHPDLKQGNYLLLSVSDTGPGIAPDVMERIFEPFFTTKEIGQGTGMGLAVVHGILKDIGGAIDVYSEIGKGTTFKVYFPLTEIESNQEETKAVAIPRGNERIMVVDDEPNLVRMVAAMLKDLGYSVESFRHSKNALEAYFDAPNNYDVIITDQTMPELTGAELAKKVLAKHPDQAIILSTGFSQTIHQDNAQQIGIAAYVSKPISKVDLAAAVRTVLDGEKTTPRSALGHSR